MAIEDIVRGVVDFTRQHADWAPFIVGALAFLESLAVISFFVPAWGMLIAIGVLMGTTDLTFWPIWLGGVVGAVLGDWLSYWVGQKLEDRAHHTWPLSKYPGEVARAEAFLTRWGPWAVFFGRFLGPLRAFVPLAAGIFRVPPFLFQMANVSSAMVWAFVLLAPGSAAGSFVLRWLS